MEGISLDFHCFKALYDAFEVQFFQGFIFTPYQRHWYHLGPCSPDFLKWKLLNNALKAPHKSLKGVNGIQRCSIENQKGAIAIDFVQQ